MRITKIFAYDFAHIRILRTFDFRARYDLIVANDKRKNRDILDKQPVWKLSEGNQHRESCGAGVAHAANKDGRNLPAPAWAPPVPLRSEKSALCDFPINALPPIIREMAEAVSVTTSTDIAMASTALLSAASYCFTGVYRMTGKRDHTEPLVMNSLIVAEPSFKKSPVIALVKQPYKQFVKEWNAANKSRIFKCQADRKLLESELDGELLLRFDEIAFKKFVDYYNDVIEKQLVTDMSFCRDWGGKYHGLILRLCGILHCIKCEMDDVPSENVLVGCDTLNEAIAIGEYYREQAVYAYGLSEVDISTVKAEHTLAKIKSKGVRIIRQNDLYKLCRCKYFRNAQEFDETMSLLEEYGYVLRQTYHGKNGNNKSGTMVFINTHIYNS